MDMQMSIPADNGEVMGQAVGGFRPELEAHTVRQSERPRAIRANCAAARDASIKGGPSILAASAALRIVL